METRNGKKQSKKQQHTKTTTTTERRCSARLNSSKEQLQQHQLQQQQLQQQQLQQLQQQQKQQQQPCDNDATQPRLMRKRIYQNETEPPANCGEKLNGNLTKKPKKKMDGSKDLSNQLDLAAASEDVITDRVLNGEVESIGKTKSYQNESASNSDEAKEDSDDDLPEFLSPIDDQFKEGDLVWVKYRSSYYWPAVAMRLKYFRKRLHKVKVAFIEYENNQLKQKPFYIRYNPDSIQPIGKNYQRCVIDGKNSSNSVHFQEAIIRVEKYMFCLDETLPNAVEFFEIESTASKNKELKSVEDEYNNFETNCSDDTSSETSSESSDDEVEKNVKIASDELYSEETRKCIEERCRQEKELINFIMNSSLVKEHLQAVRLGQKPSIFQTNFKKHKTESENRAISRQGFGPLGYDSSMVLRGFLLNFICEVDKRSKSILEDNFYLMDVWMPEAIICGIQERDGITREKAEEIFRTGIQYTEEESRRNTDYLIANTTDVDREKQKERSRRSFNSERLCFL